MSDLDTLVDMGFDREKSSMALKHGGNLQQAIDWLDTNADKSVEELKEEEAASANEPPALKEGEEPRSLVCNECQKKFRSQAQAEFHASKSGHTDFAESTEEIAPLTEEEKKAKLEELRERMQAKRAAQGEQDKLDRKRNEEIRRKSTKEVQDAKEDLEKKEQIKEAQKKKLEKQADIDAKRRVQAKIAADKEERRRKAETEKAQREQQTFPTGPVQQDLPAETPVPTSKPASEYTEARLRLQTPAGTVQKTFSANTTLFEVAEVIGQEKGIEIASFQSTFPKKMWDRSDFGQTLREAGLVPSAALIVR